MIHLYQDALSRGMSIVEASNLAVSSAVARYSQHILENDSCRLMIVIAQATLAAEILIESDQHDLAVLLMYSMVHLQNIFQCWVQSNNSSAGSGTLVSLLPTNDYLKVKDAMNGCTSTIAKYIAKRIPCKCLEGMHRKKHRTGICDWCHARRRTKTLLLCSGCTQMQYCSAECQRSDWPRHKELCEAVREIR